MRLSSRGLFDGFDELTASKSRKTYRLHEAPSPKTRGAGDRKIIYTTNAIESLNSSFRKISRHRNIFPTVDSLFKLFYLSLKNISRKWTQTVPNWPNALSYFAIEFEDRMPNNH